MSLDKGTIWKVLREIDVSSAAQKKNNLDYLPWAYVHSVLMETYPQHTVSYHVEKYEDGSAEVVCLIQIEEVTQACHLPVMSYNNKAIITPNSFDINSTRQRAFVKCAALLGLGLNLYGAELGIGREEGSQALSVAIRENFHSISAIKEGLVESPDTESGFQDLESAAQIWFELDDDTKKALWVSTKAGGPWTTQERAIMKTPQFRQAYYGLEE